MKIYCEYSDKFQINKTKDTEKIYFINQFFIHPNKERHDEILFCLKKNILNENIHKIYLLNERIYTKEELGISSDKIIQININKRLQYSDIFHFVESEKLNGYIVFCNSDIFLDNTISILNNSRLQENKQFIGLLRYEYINETQSRLFGPRPDSQDTWIFHSKMNINKGDRNMFNFHFGMPGCDNKLLYLLKTIGYKLLNIPHLIKTFHVHQTQIRNYTSNNIVSDPFLFLEPFGYNTCRFHENVPIKDIS